MLDDIDLDVPEEEGSTPSGGNGRFMMIAGVLGAVLLLALIGVAIYALVILPGQQAAPAQPDAALSLQETATALALAQQATNTTAPTNTSVPPTATSSSTPTATEVTPIFTSQAGPATATVNALLTQAAQSQTEAASPTTPTATPSSLPESGFADEMGAPGLLAAAGLLLFVIFFARRLRASNY